MRPGLTIAALICVCLALGHAIIGLRWVVPNLTKERFPATPFGRPSTKASMMRFTWHDVTAQHLAFPGGSAVPGHSRSVLDRLDMNQSLRCGEC
jgi:hypothetical protein